MNPQPPVTKMRIAPDSSDAAGVKDQTSHDGHKGDKGPQRIAENEIAKQIPNNGQLDDAETPGISL